MLRSVGVRQYRECSRFLNPLCKRKAKHAVSNDTVPARARGGSVHQKRAVFYFCSTFGCSLAVPRCRMKNARNARFTFEKDEWRFIRSDQIKSMISEF